MSIWSAVDEVDLPEDVEVGDNDDESDSDTEKSRPSRCAHSQCSQRHPDCHEPIGADNDNQPGAEMQSNQQRKHENATGCRRRVQPLDAEDHPDPRLERAHEQDDCIDDGQHQQVTVDRRGAHASSQHYRRRHDVSGRTDENDDRKQISDERKGDTEACRQLLRRDVVIRSVVVIVVVVRCCIGIVARNRRSVA